MYDEDKVEDSLEFCKDIKIYLDQDGKSEKYVLLREYGKREHSKKRDLSNKYAYQNLDSIRKDVDAGDGVSVIREVFKDLLYVSVCIVISFVFAYLLTRYVAHHNMVEGNSMQPTLHNGDYLIVEKVSYLFHKPKRYEIIIFPVKGEVNYIKRIIGLPGEKIRIRDGEVYVNGEKLNDPFGYEAMEEPGLAENEITLEEDEYFVLGDNRNASIDSRKAVVGMVKEEDILGRAWFRFYPFDAIGFLGAKDG